MTERFDLAALPWQAWKNGAGRTQEIAVEPPGAALDAFDWRFSLAEVARDAPFSAYPGIDRCIVLWRGPGLRMASDDGGIEHRLDQPLQPWRFAGEVALQARLLGGASTDFNVMTRRGLFQADVRVLDAAQPLSPADALLVLAAVGSWSVEDTVLDPGQGLLWRRPCGELPVAPLRDPRDARLLAVRLLREAAR